MSFATWKFTDIKETQTWIKYSTSFDTFFLMSVNMFVHNPLPVEFSWGLHVNLHVPINMPVLFHIIMEILFCSASVHRICPFRMTRRTPCALFIFFLNPPPPPAHTCHKLWTEICEIRQNFKWDLIKFCEIFIKITLKLPQTSQKPSF